MAAAGFDWKCRCGQVHFRIAPGRSREVTCYCAYCRKFSDEMGEGGTLDPGGGVPLAMMMPDRIEVVAGGGDIAAMHYTRKGALRWYAKCCNTPIASTLSTGRIPFVSFVATRLDPQAALGPPLYCANTGGAKGPVADARGARLPLMAGLVAQVLGARLSGRWRRSPFFDAAGEPRATPDYRPWKPD